MKNALLRFLKSSRWWRRSPSDFDPVFYAKHYPDLANLKGHRSLLAHYLKHGKDEGRHTTEKIARDHFAAQGKLLPADFSVAGYKVLNPDLTRLFSEDWQYKLHFISSGAEEGRGYRFQGHSLEDAWQTVFDLYDFALSSSSWRTEQNLTRESAIELFISEGIARLTPIAQEWRFDPEFYMQQYGISEVDAKHLYKHWLFSGFAKGFAPNETRVVSDLLVGADYPDCFDWRAYLGHQKTETTYPSKIDALRGAFAQPQMLNLRKYVKGNGSAAFYLSIGDYHLVRGNYSVAERAYSCSLDITGTSKAYLRRGDAFRQLGENASAIRDYLKATEFPTYSVWAVVHAATLMMHEQRGTESFELLSTVHGKWAGHPEFRQAVDCCINIRFQQISENLTKRLNLSLVKEANQHADLELDTLSFFISDLKLRTVGLIPAGDKRVVMLANQDLPQCTHYRVKQKQEQMSARGAIIEVFDQSNPDAFMNALPGAGAAVFYRVPSYPKIIEAILYARALGIRTFFDIDDLVFTADFPDSFASYGGQISHSEYIGLQWGVPLFRQAIKLCDFGIASTKALSERLGPLVRSQSAFVVSNGLDSASDLAVEIGRYVSRTHEQITIFYGSGTKAHNEDFNVIVGPALIKILVAYPQVRLVIVGYLKLDKIFADFNDRVFCFPFINDIGQYWALLSLCDINISILNSGAVTDCKSEIKWLEAAVLQIPSVLSRTVTFSDVVTAEVDGLLASSPAEWEKAFIDLIDNSSKRLAMGRAAQIKAFRDYSLGKLADRLYGILFEEVKVGTPPGASSYPKAMPHILICNVFFAPQSHGGATRVVEDNVNYFIKQYSSSFQVSILATDDRMPVGQFRVETYKGCTVYRLATPLHQNMDWRPFNRENEVPYRRVLDIVRPDLVHFHCIQRLTASIAEVTLHSNIPYVVTAHDAWWISDYQFMIDEDNSAVNISSSSLAGSLPSGVSRLQAIERKQRLLTLLQAAHLTLPVSTSFGKIYRSAGIDNIRVIENGISSLPPSVESLLDKRLTLAHIGGKSVHKGSSLIESAFRENRFNNIKLIMIDGSLEFGEERTTFWGETEVSLKGPYPQKRINELYATFDVLLAPSIWPESYGLVTREAIYYRKFVIASDRGAIADDIVEGKNGFKINVENPDHLASVLSAMNADPASFRSSAHTFALRSSDDQAEELAKLYIEILGCLRHIVSE